MVKWFMTVGYPGGEFAAPDPQMLTLDNVGCPQDRNFAYTLPAYHIRPCPPDLVVWLDANPDMPIEDDSVGSYRWKRPGGWLEVVYWDNQNALPPQLKEGAFLVSTPQGSVSSTFIPVAHAPSITVLPEVPSE